MTPQDAAQQAPDEGMHGHYGMDGLHAHDDDWVHEPAPAEGLREAQRLLAEVDEWAHGAGVVEGVFARVAGYVNEYLIDFTPADNPLFPDRAALAQPEREAK